MQNPWNEREMVENCFAENLSLGGKYAKCREYFWE